MKQFSLDEYLKNPNKKVVTRTGIPVKIHCTNFVTTHKPVIAEIAGRGYSQSFTKEGRFYEDTYESSEDLFFAPEKHEGWINIYKNERKQYFGKFIYPRKTDAEVVADNTCIVTAKIEWEE